jgi:Peptidase C13 family
MRYALTALVHNLAAGARVALFRPVQRAAFRIDVVQWLAIVVVSALIDVALDGLRAGPDARWTLLGIDGELFALGLLMLTSAIVAAAFRDASIFMDLPLVVLAAFPVLQTVHALPAILHADLAPAMSSMFDIAIFAWMVAVCMRAVYVLSEAPARRRLLRAAAGGLLLSLPLWFAPLAGPSDGWWVEDDSGATAAQDANPASEAVMAVQAYLLDHALDNLEDERGGVTDLYFVGFAPDARWNGFREELELAQRVLDERFDTRGRSLNLLNHRDTVTEIPFATLTNLRRTLQEIGDTIDPDDDVVMLYLAAGPGADDGLAAVHPPLDLVPVTPESIKQLLDAAGIRFRVIVVSTCAAGAWVDALRDEDTAVLVSSPGDSRAPGCEGGAQPSPFSDALFGHALRSADSVPAGFADAARELGQGGSAPQLWMGQGVEAQLRRVKHGAPMRTAALR